MPVSDAVDPALISTRDEFKKGLSQVRAITQLTIREVASKADVPFSTVGGYFSGRHLPTPAQFAQFARIIGACGVTNPAEVDAWLDAVRRVRRTLGRPPAGSVPYRGLAAFQPEDAEWFHGRETLTQTLLERLREPTDGPLIVVGSSGSGKSSLLRAGLAAHVPPEWSCVVAAPGAEPHHVFAQLVEGENKLLVVDQFEEIFTQCENDHDRRSFIDAVHSVSCRVVLGMRSDFYTHALRYPRLAESLQRNQLVVGPMTEDELRRAITEPARKARVDLDDGLVELLIYELAPTVGEGQAAHDSGALPLLSHALLATWEHGERQRMTAADYRATGGIAGAVAQTAETVYLQLNDGEQSAVRRTFLRLVHVGEDSADTRRRVDRTELMPAAGDDDTVTVLDHYVAERLITTDEDSVEISHEALLTAWPRLRSWIDSDRAGIRVHRSLTEAARQWQDSGRDFGGLYRGGRLTAAVEWAEDQAHRAGLNQLEREFLDASFAAEGAERLRDRRRARLLRRLVAVLIVFALAAFGLAGYAFNQQLVADTARDSAISRQVATTANRLRDSDPALAAQLSLAAYRIAPTMEARSSLLATSAVPRVTRFVRPDGSLQSVAVSPDGKLFAAAGAVTHDHDVLFWDLADRARPTRLPGRLAGHSDAVFATAFHPNGRLVATGSADRSVRLWDVSSPAAPRPVGPALTGASSGILSVAFSPDGTLLAAGGADGTLRLWDMHDPAHPVMRHQLVGAVGDIRGIAFSPDGQTLAIADGAGAVRIWDMTNPRHIAHAVASLSLPSRVNTVAFMPTGTQLIAGSNDGLLRTWDTRDPAHPTAIGDPIEAATGWITALAVAPRGSIVAVANADSAVQLWDLDTQRAVAVLPHPEPVTAVTFLDGGQTLLTNSADGAARLWPIPGPTISNASKNAAKAITTIAFHPNGRVLAAAGPDIQLWDVADRNHPHPVGPTLTAPAGYDRMSGTATISPDGRLLAAGTRSGNAVIVWDITDPTRPVRKQRALTGTTALIENVRFSPDGQLIAAASDDGAVRLWRVDANTQQPLTILEPHAGEVYMTAFSPDSHLLAAATGDGLVPMWDISKHHAPRLTQPPLQASPDEVYSVAFRPDGRALAAGSGDATVRIWDIRDHDVLGEPAIRLSGPDGYLMSLAFSPDGHALAGGTGTGQTWLWDLTKTSPRADAVITTTTDNIWTLAYHPNAPLLAAANGGIRLMETDPAKVANEICATAGQPITKTEWQKHAPGAEYMTVCP
jgi:WD40 repeat protein